MSWYEYVKVKDVGTRILYVYDELFVSLRPIP